MLYRYSWLDLGVHATKAAKSNGTYSKDFYESKIHTMKYFFTYELPKTTGLSEILFNSESITIKKETEPVI
jgi:butyryl-CoA dehydrogenase